MSERLNPYYISGFVDGEGCFAITLSRAPSKRHGVDARLLFEIELRADDVEILERIKETLGCGHLYRLDYRRYGWKPHVKYKVSSFKEIDEKLIPFFERYHLQAKKRKSFKLFCEAANIIRSKRHLTKRGLGELRALQGKMRNSGKKAEPPGYGKTVRPVV